MMFVVACAAHALRCPVTELCCNLDVCEQGLRNSFNIGGIDKKEYMEMKTTGGRNSDMFFICLEGSLTARVRLWT